jgi:hypothetical protein
LFARLRLCGRRSVVVGACPLGGGGNVSFNPYHSKPEARATILWTNNNIPKLLISPTRLHMYPIRSYGKGQHFLSTVHYLPSGSSHHRWGVIVSGHRTLFAYVRQHFSPCKGRLWECSTRKSRTRRCVWILYTFCNRCFIVLIIQLYGQAVFHDQLLYVFNNSYQIARLWISNGQLYFALNMCRPAIVRSNNRRTGVKMSVSAVLQSGHDYSAN